MKNIRLQQQLIEEINLFIDKQKSLLLSTLSVSKQPHSSYAPFFVYQNGFYIFVSQLALHTQHLLDSSIASILLIEDESVCDDIFARQRLTYDVSVNMIERNDTLWTQVIEGMTERLGERVTLLSQLGDFVLFQLTPTSGRYIKGFGKAYDLSGVDLNIEDIQHVRS